MRVDNIEANKKRAERLARRQEQEQEDYSDDFNNLFNENVITYHNKYKTDVFNEAKNLLDFNYIISIQGRVYIDDEVHIPNFLSNVYIIRDKLENWINALEESYDLSNWILTSEIIIHEINKKFKIVNRSRRGMGINSLFIINEYDGRYCYIPSSDFCFIKCCKRLIGEEKFINYNIEKRFNRFLLEKSERKGVMSNARITKFNNEFNESLTAYELSQRKYKSLNKSQTPYNDVLYLYFHDEYSSIGHYCLIDKNNVLSGIQEIKQNFVKRWKQCNENVSLTLPHFTNTVDKSDDKNTYIWDLEIYKEEYISYPYSLQMINLNKFNSIIGEDINSEKPLSEEKKNKLLDSVLVFVGENCIDQALNHLGKFNKQNVTLIAHNGSSFDNFFVIRNFHAKFKNILKTPRGILSLKVENPYTLDTISKKLLKLKNEYNRTRGYKDQNTTILQQISFICSYQHAKSSLRS